LVVQKWKASLNEAAVNKKEMIEGKNQEAGHRC
jgi:hypothetical protein